MLSGKRALTELIGSVYEAAGDPTLWEAFLERLADVFRADAAGLVMHNDGQEAHAITSSFHVDPEMLRLYREYYGPLDIWTARGTSKPAGYVCASESLCSFEELATTEVYNDLMVRFDIKHGMFGVIQKSASCWSTVSLYRGSASHEFRASHVEGLRVLVPHVQRAFKLHFQFSELKSRIEGIEAALNMLAAGVIFVGQRGEVILMNTEAEQLVRSRDGLLLEGGKLRAAVGAESDRLQSLISSAMQTSNGKGMGSGGTIPISRKQGRSLSVTVAPLRNINVGIAQQPSAVLFISDPDDNVELPSDFLSRCHGLTQAEARLAMMLVEGRPLKEVADFCGVTHNTAKSQLKSIFTKTGVQRQAQLVRLILSAPLLRNSSPSNAKSHR